MTAKYNGHNERIKKSEERQAKMEQAEGITLKGNFEPRRSGWNKEEIKHLVLNLGVLIALKLFAPFGLPKDGRSQAPTGPAQGRNESGTGEEKEGVNSKLLIRMAREAIKC